MMGERDSVIAKLFTKKSHHGNVSVIYIVQNLFLYDFFCFLVPDDIALLVQLKTKYFRYDIGKLRDPKSYGKKHQ